MSYFDKDGLLRKYGTEKAVPNKGGEFKTYGELRTIEVKVDLTTLTTGTGSASILTDQVFVPSGVRVEEVEVVALTSASTTSTATLNVGLIKTDRTTLLSATALVSGLAVTAIDSTGEKTVLRVGSTSAGSSIGTTTTAVHHIMANTSTGTFNAGAAIVRVKYINPTLT